MPSNPPSMNPGTGDRWQRVRAASVRAFHAYAGWLVGISWRRFIAYALLLLIVVAIVHDSPPFTWRIVERVETTSAPRNEAQPPRPPVPPKPGSPPGTVERSRAIGGDKDLDISIGKDGIHIRSGSAAAAASAAQAAGQHAEAAASAASAAGSSAQAGITIRLPAGADNEAVREAIAEARRQIEEAVREAKEEAAQAVQDAAEARRDAEAAIAEIGNGDGRRRTVTRTTRYGVGDFLMQFTVLWVFASALLKTVYKGRMQAEVKAAQAAETAESESLKRQVVEARMAAMQAQVEPHFLFNTLASIDHLIETDPARASLMQKNLIALLRASMPSMREVNGPVGASTRDLGRELAVIRPYLEILKVRMEERLSTEIRVSDGLLSAEFPPMMLQSLVENAIKHGLEPKAEGGQLVVSAEIVHGKLAVTVADTGLGFGKAATAGTGIGLSNIRERLQLLYGGKASLKVAENPGGGTAVTITVPYHATSTGEAMA